MIRPWISSKVVQRQASIALLLLIPAGTVHGQNDPELTPSFGFGFFLSADRCMPSVTMREHNTLSATASDSLQSVTGEPIMGFSMGMLYERTLSEHWSLRVPLGLHFSGGGLKYEYADGSEEIKEFEETSLGLAVHLLGFSAKKRRGPYLSIGPAIRYSMVRAAGPKATTVQVEGALGFRARPLNFSMAAELRYAYAFTNSLVDRSTIHGQAIDELRLHTLSLVVLFQD